MTSIIEEHYRSNYERLVKRTTRRVPHNSSALAEEVVQEAYTRALKYLVAFDERINTFDVWFNTILRNATNTCRADEGDGGVTKEFDDNLEALHIEKKKRQSTPIVREIELIRQKNPKTGEALRLFFIVGFTAKDVGEYLGLSHTNVRQLIMRFRNSVVNKL